MSQLIDARFLKPKSRIICISPLPPEFSLYQYEFFKQFGELRFLGIDKNPRKQRPKIAFVEFQDIHDSVAEELIAKGKIDFEDKKLEVKSYKQYIQRFRRISANVLNVVDTIDELSQPPASDSPKNILNVLNDDCLREIFKKLHFSTLNAVVNVCIRFNRVAKEALAIKYQLKTMNILDLAWNRRPTISQIENFLSNFGDVIPSISIFKKTTFGYYGKNEDKTAQLKIISKYCTKLTSLEFDCFNMSDRTLYEIRSLFKRLKKLKIHNILRGSIFVVLTRLCYDLETLELSFGGNYDIVKAFFALPNIALPNLVEVRILDVIGENPSFCLAICKFVELHSKLKTLKIHLDIRLHGTMNALARLHELNELDVDITAPNALQALQQAFSVQIENLKLEISACDINNDFLNTISQFRHINTLIISVVFDINELIRLLQTLPHLKTLGLTSRRRKLFDGPDSKSIITVINTILQHENELSKLTFQSFHPKRKYPFDDASYYNILDTVKNRNTCELTIVYTFRTNLACKKYAEDNESILILNMVPDALTIEQRTRS